MTATECQGVADAAHLVLLVLLGWAVVALQRERARTDRALHEVASWRFHHIKMMRLQHEWFREKWRRVHGKPPERYHDGPAS